MVTAADTTSTATPPPTHQSVAARSQAGGSNATVGRCSDIRPVATVND